MTSVFSPQTLLRNTFLQHVEIFESLGSTQDQALELCADASLKLPALIVAERQSAGRGRSGANWWSPQGALLFSLIVPLPRRFAQPESSSQLSLAIASAVARYLQEALRPSGNDHLVRVKPPNDVYVSHAKIAGLLIDVPHQPDREQRGAILGIGLNINNDCSKSPIEVTVPAVSLSQLTGHKHDLQKSLISLLAHLFNAALQPPTSNL